MKRLLCIVILVALLLGCSKNDGMDKSLRLRNSLLQAEGCSFNVRITADYGQDQYVFTENCKSDQNGNLEFHVQEPETICGITGRIDDSVGDLTFDDDFLAFPILADGTLTPVSAPWILLHSLRGGYIHACEAKADGTKIIIHDSFQHSSLECHVYCNKTNLPCFAEIFWEGSRIISLQISEFEIL